MMWLVTFLACFGLIHAAEPFNHRVHNERVRRSTDARPNHWKWQVSVQLSSGEKGLYHHICGGFILHRDLIVTAAHCVNSDDPSQYRVVAGEYDLNRHDKNEQVLTVERITVHPEWDGDVINGNDIALMKLAKPIDSNDNVARASLPFSHETTNDAYCYLTGWRVNEDYGGSTPGILQQSRVEVIKNAVCSQPEWWGQQVLESMVCAKEESPDCQETPGGLLNCFHGHEWKVHGVVTYGPSGDCNLEDKLTNYIKPIVFTRVASFLDWFQQPVIRDQ